MMDSQVLSVVIAVQKYKSFLHADAMAKGEPWQKVSGAAFDKVRAYYMSLPLPPGMNASDACFEDVLRYDTSEAVNAEENELGRFPWKFYEKSRGGLS